MTFDMSFPPKGNKVQLEGRYVAVDMTNGLTYIGREEKVLLNAGRRARIDPDRRNLEDVVTVKTLVNIGDDSHLHCKDVASEYARFYQTAAPQLKFTKTMRLPDFRNNPHVVYVWDLDML